MYIAIVVNTFLFSCSFQCKPSRMKALLYTWEWSIRKSLSLVWEGATDAGLWNVAFDWSIATTWPWISNGIALIPFEPFKCCFWLDIWNNQSDNSYSILFYFLQVTYFLLFYFLTTSNLLSYSLLFYFLTSSNLLSSFLLSY